LRHQSRNQLPMLLQLFWVFLRIGPATFGGGYAMIPLIEREVMTRRQWVKEEDMSDLLAVAGSAPGGVGVNAAALIGYRKAGIGGAVAAIAGMTMPAFMLVLLVSLLYTQYAEYQKVAAAMQGVKGAVIALIGIAAYRMVKSSVFDMATIAISVVALVVLLITNIHPLFAIVAGLASGLILVKVKLLLGWKVQTEKALKVQQVASENIYPEYYI